MKNNEQNYYGITIFITSITVTIIVSMVWVQYSMAKDIKGFTDCITYKVGGYYEMIKKNRKIVYEAGDTVCYRINKDGLQDIYLIN